jgi:hypothetical protein
MGDVAPKPGATVTVGPSTPQWVIGAAAGMSRRTKTVPKTDVYKKKFAAFILHLDHPLLISFVYTRCVHAGEDSNSLLAGKYGMSRLFSNFCGGKIPSFR